MNVSRRRALRNISLLGTSAGLVGCGFTSKKDTPPPAPEQSVAPAQAVTAPLTPIRLTISGLCMLKQNKTGAITTRADIALLTAPKKSGLQVPDHLATLSIPRLLFESSSVAASASTPDALYWNLADTRVDMEVDATNGTTYSSITGTGSIQWNEGNEDVFSCASSRTFRGVQSFPHMSEFAEKATKDWDSPKNASATVHLSFGSFEHVGLPLSAREKQDVSAWIFRRSKDNQSKWKDAKGADRARAIKNVVTVALIDYKQIRFLLDRGGQKGQIVVNAVPRDPKKFNAEVDTISISNLASAHQMTNKVDDFRAYFELTEPAPGKSTALDERYFPTDESACITMKTIECGCCPPTIID